MIEGLNILNTIEKVSTEELSIGILEIILGIVCIVAGIRLIVDIVENFFGPASTFFLSTIVAICIIVGAADIYLGIKHLNNRQTFVQATVDEHTSWKQINEQYDLVSQDGQIYTFTFKEAE